jgi:uncharacterized protein
MKCPACFNELTPLQVGQVTVDVCRGGCGGIWFDTFELQRVDEQEEVAGEWLLHIEQDKSIRVDANRKRECPRCEGVKLKRHFFSRKRQVQVDECPGCGGYWLDAGELEQIRDETEETKFIEKVRQSTVTTAVVRYLYQLRQESRE